MKKFWMLLIALVLCTNIAVPVSAVKKVVVQKEDIWQLEGMQIMDVIYLGDLIVVCKEENGSRKFGMINSFGEEVLPFAYEFLDIGSENMYFAKWVEEDGTEKSGYINRDGEVLVLSRMIPSCPFIIGKKYFRVLDYSTNEAGFMDMNGEIAFCWDNASLGSFVSEDMVQFSTGDRSKKVGFLNIDGEVAVEPQYDYAGDFYEGLAVVATYNRSGNLVYGAIDTSGNIVIPMMYDSLSDFFGGQAAFNRAGVVGYIDKDGRETVLPDYDHLAGFAGGYAVVGKKDADGNTKYGYIDENYKLAIPLTYDRAERYGDGMAAVAKKDANGNLKWGYIDEDGRMVTPLEYDSAGYANYTYGYAVVGKIDPASNTMRYGAINIAGEELIPLDYDYMDEWACVIVACSGDEEIYFVRKMIVPEVTPDSTPDSAPPAEEDAEEADDREKAQGGSPAVLYIGIGVSVLALVIVLVAVAGKKRKVRSVSAPDNVPVPRVEICACGHKNDPSFRFCEKCGKPL